MVAAIILISTFFLENNYWFAVLGMYGSFCMLKVLCNLIIVSYVYPTDKDKGIHLIVFFLAEDFKLIPTHSATPFTYDLLAKTFKEVAKQEKKIAKNYLILREL